MTAVRNANQRFYASSLGRFATVDPYRASGAPNQPGSWNRYAYVGGDPANLFDQHGTDSDCNPYEACDLCDPIYDRNACLCTALANACGGPGPDPGPGPEPSGPDCNQITAAAGFTGLTYAKASQIWADGNLAGYSTNGTAATVAALAAVTWQGESGFQLNPANNGNYNDKGVLTSVDYGPFQINQRLHPNANGAVWGTNGAGQSFNGNADANISFGIQILEGLFDHYGNNAAGRYVGSLGNDKAGKPINVNAQRREATWNSSGAGLTTLFSNTDCFSHK